MNYSNELKDWEELLAALQAEAHRVASNEGWQLPHTCAPATDLEILKTEQRLNVVFPLSIRTFYQTSNGLSAVGWALGAIYPVSQIDYLRHVEYSALSCAKLVEENDKPFRRDPDGTRKRNYVYEKSTRVQRSLVLTSSIDDGVVVMVDPQEQNADGEWACGTWWQGSANWEIPTFRDYIIHRLKFLQEMNT